MALLKNNHFSQISGKTGGNIYHQDRSGQHVYAYPRTVKRADTLANKKSKNHYAGKKKEEHHGGPYLPPFEFPKEPTTGIVLSLEVLWAHRQPTILPPVEKEIEYSGFYYDQIILWIQANWNPAWAEWGLTKEIMKLMMMKWFYIYAYTKGLGADVALQGAKTMMLHWISQGASSCAVPALGLWAGIIALGLYFDLIEWLEGHTAFISFNKGRVLIWQNGQLWWGGLIARPTQKMYEFWKCRLTDFHAYRWVLTPGYTFAQLTWLYIEELFQTKWPRWLMWYVYTWQEIKCRFRGYCYTVSPAVVRLECEPSQQKYWDKPVGWYQTIEPACNYLYIFDDYWAWQGHPAPPL